jgi:Ser/Thr protein kinase RdoA (MazF antagonist)
VPAGVPLTPEEVEAIRAVGDNTGSMALKGGSPDHDGDPRPDRWELGDRLAEVAARWGIDPARDLAQSPVPAGSTGSPAARQA